MNWSGQFRGLMLGAMVLTTVAGAAPDLGELMRSGQWRCHYSGEMSVTPIEKALGDSPGIEIACEPSPENVTYAAVSVTIATPVNMSGLSAICFMARADRPARPRLTLQCEGGSLTRDFDRQPLSSAYRRVEMVRADMAVKSDPDLARVTSLTISFGLWDFDTSEAGFTITLAGLEYVGTETRYIISRPKRGVSIDGEFKDWGYEDTLYNWTAPEYVHLDGVEFVVAGGPVWSGADQLSGRFAMMMDRGKLHFLALVADTTPFEGADPAQPWRNDSLELFLAARPSDHDLRSGGQPDAQVVFDCGKDPTAAICLSQGRQTPCHVERRTVPATWVLHGRQASGYVVEAAIPLADLGLEELARGDVLGYSVKLNDSSGLSLIATPGNPRPHASIKGFRKAWVEVVVERTAGIVFGPPAANALWSERFGPDPGQRVWDMAAAHREQVSATRSRLYLNTLWAVQGVDSDDRGPDPAGWRYMPLPMGIGWYTPVMKLDDDGCLGREVGYVALDKDRSFFWFERTFEPDPSARGGRVELTFEYVTGEATVYLNGEPVGQADSAWTSFDVTDRIVYGQPNRLDVLLYQVVHPGVSVRNGIGITGDIYLEHHSRAPAIDDVWVKHASGLDGAFELVVETGPAARGGELVLDILAEDGSIVGGARQAVEGGATTLTGSCPGFAPWSPEAPNLFTARVGLMSEGELVDECRRRFGFRTFEISGARFRLNGKVLRLRAAHATNVSGVMEPGRFDALRRSGHNSIFMHAAHAGYNEPLFSRMDEEGFVGFVPTARDWSDEKTIAEIRRYRSHPCVLAYVSDQLGQLDCNGFSHNPFSVSDSYYPDSERAVKLYRFLRARAGLFASVDPTRPYFPHATGNFEGSFRSTNHYPTYDLNLLDHAMYYVLWSQREEPQLPYHLYECGVHALYYDITHPEHSFEVEEGRSVTRRIDYECAARYLGPRAFEDWMEWEAMFMRASLRGFRLCGIDGFMPWVGDDCFLAPANTTRAQDIPDDRRLSWRQFALPYAQSLDDSWMRMSSWYYRLRAQARWQWPTEYGQPPIEPERCEFSGIYENEMQPLCAFIAGSDPDAFTRERSFYPGERIAKQVVVANDTERALDVVAHVAFTLGDHTEARALELRVRQGGVLRAPVVFDVPGVPAKSFGALALTLTARGDLERTDRSEITVFPKPDGRSRPWQAEGWSGSVGVVRAVGEPSLLQAMGLPARVVTLDGDLPADLDVLVIERGALARDADGGALERYLSAGGRVLILEQTDRGLLDWRLRERRLEAVFIADRTHPALAGLDDRDLAYFRGPATIVPRERRPSRFCRHGQSVAMETPHLTNVGLVASYAIAKPAYGAVHPLLVGGWDLEECALLEARSGAGRVMLCQVDISDRYGLDPAATLLADNILRYILAAPAEPSPTDVAYLGGPRGAALLDRLGIAYVPATDAGGPGQVLVIGEGPGPDAARLSGFRTAVVLPMAECLPAGVAAAPVKLQQSDHPHYWNTSTYQFELLKSLRPSPDRLSDDPPDVFRGLVDNDTYFFESPPLRAFEAAGAFAVEWSSERGTMLVGRSGDTRVVLCSADPGAMEHGECRRKALRIWSVALANLGVACSHNMRFEAPGADISGGQWTFLTDPDGSGAEVGYARGEFAGRTPEPMLVGRVWEEQGVTEANPSIASPPDSAYDGFGWYFRRAVVPAHLRGGALYLHADGVRDISTYDRTASRTNLWLNGVKQADPVGVYNARRGGRAGRLWQLSPDDVLFGEENLIAIRVYNDVGAGGLHRRPVRFEIEGRNQGMLFPYEFIRSKYDPYFFWAW